MQLSEAAIAEATSQVDIDPPPMQPMRPMEVYEQPGPDPLQVEQVELDTGSSSGEAETGVAVKPSTRSWWQGSSSDRQKASYEDQLRVMLGQKPKEPEDGCWRFCPDLSWDDRILGFIGCYVIGCALSVSSMLSFTKLLAGNPTQFALKLALGNVLSISAACFLAGPRRQAEKMTDPSRMGATLMYVGSIAFTLFAALCLQVFVVTLVALVLQSAALFWYGISFIPYGRRLVQSCAGRFCKAAWGVCGQCVRSSVKAMV